LIVNEACPPDEVLNRLLNGELSAVEETQLDDHVSHCTKCQQRLEQITQGATPYPADLAAPSQRLRPPAVKGSILRRVAELTHTPPFAFSAEGQPEATPLSSSPGDPAAGQKSAVRRLETADGVLRRSWTGSSAVLQSTGRFFRRQLWTWPVVAALLLGGLGWWVSRTLEGAMRRQRVNELTTVLDADVAALRIWMDNRRATAELIASNDRLRPKVAALLNPNAATDAAKRSSTTAALRAILAKPLGRAGFTGFVLVSRDGVVLAADQDAPIGQKLSGYRLEFFQAVASGNAAISRPFRSPLLLADQQGHLRAGLPCMYAAAPVHDSAGMPVAVLGLRIRPEDQFTRILQVARSGQTGETYAFDRNGLLLSQSRFDEDLKQIGLLVDQSDSRSILTLEVRDPQVNMAEGKRPSLRRTEQSLTRMAADAVQGNSGYDADGYRDYRGVPVVGAWTWLDDYDFGVATEIDVDEAFRPVHLLRRVYAVLMGLLFVSSIGMLASTLIVARQRRALRKATLTAKQLGQYTLIEEIGSGGMGTVYKARHALLRRPTAVKLLNAGVMSLQSVARFEREVQLTAGLTHPNTVMIFDYGRTPEGIFYYAMEYLTGVNLNELVDRYGPLPEARVVHILRQVCESLAEAHATGLVHRDVKPSNIVLTCRGGIYDFVKVVDFGLVKSLDGKEQASITSPNSLAGTPHYLSPEAIDRSGPVDARADVYALGAVAYFLLTGTTVFDGNSVIEVCMKHAAEKPESPSARIDDPVSPDLERIVLRCLAKSPLDRPADAGALLRELASCANSGHWSPADAAAWWASHADGPR
jgi:eukaryotic-like serine/threonine-protein kinase